MAERDRAAVHVELLVRDPELAHHHEARGRVRLVVLEQVDILDPEARLLQELPDAGDRRLHDRLRLHADGVVRDDTGERLHAVALRGVLGHHDHRRRAVAQLRRVPGRHLTALPEHGREPRQLLEGGVRADAFVDLDAARAGDLDGDDLLLEPALLGRAGGPSLIPTPQRASFTRYGARLIDSIPPARRISAEPARIMSEANMTACSPEPQTLLIVTAPTRSGKPPNSAACRAGF